MQELLIKYRDRLTDLTAKNKSLRLMRLTNKNHFDLYSLHTLNMGLVRKAMDEIVSLKSLVQLVPCNSFDEEGIMLNHKLTQLKREIDLIEQETGTNTFHIAFSFLEGYLVEDFYLRCPILFYPARLTKTNINKIPYWVIELEEETPPFVNRTFILAANKYLGIKIGNEIDEKFKDLTPDTAIPIIQQVLREYDIKAQVNPAEKILPLKNMKKEDIPNQKGFTIKPYCVIGKFQQSTSTLLKDYEFLIENPPEYGLLHSLFHQKEGNDEQEFTTEILNEVTESDTFFVLNTDASQESAVVASRKQNGLIVHGPPGTGKSQVIVNLIADRLARNERVLVVCQKPVALDVVYNRLSSIHLHKHIALVHDFNKSKQDVYSKIASVIERQIPNHSNQHVRISNELQALASKLNQIADTLHKPRPFGRTLYNLYTTAKWNTELLIEVQDLIKDETFDTLHGHLVDLRVIMELMKKYDHADYPWMHRMSFATFPIQQQLILENLIKNIVSDVKSGQELRNRQDLYYSPEYFLSNKESLNGLERALLVLNNRNMYKHISLFYKDEDREFENIEHLDNVKKLFGVLKKQIDLLSNRAEPVSTLTVEEARTWNDKIKQFLELNKKITKYVNSNWYSLRKELQNHCLAHNISFEGTTVRNYLEKIESFLLFEELRVKAGKGYFFSDAPVLNEVAEWEKWVHLKNRALEFLELFVEAQNTFPKWLETPQNKEDLERLLENKVEIQIKDFKEVSEITYRLQSSMSALEQFLQKKQVDECMNELNQGVYDVRKYENLFRTIESFDSMKRLDQLKLAMLELQQKLIERCREKASIEQTENLIDTWSAIIENSFLHTWILLVEQEEPHIQDVSTEIYHNHLDRYTNLFQSKREAVPAIIDSGLAQEVSEVPQAVRRQLKTEASRKRKQASLRQITGTFTEDLLKLVPCWLCTPEAVSAIFPEIAELFDLVIFDEASQCPIENALPSIYRGKKLVVAGDEKQLPPTSFFQKSTEDDDENANEEDNALYKDQTDLLAKSLLEWSKPRFPDTWLTGHYRSKYEELINFSNYAFYGKRMQISPRVDKERDSKPFEFIMVNGQWLNSQNRQEAETIVETVVGILKADQTSPTIGIITFNSPQADLINDMFDERAAKDLEAQVLIERAKQRKNGEENVGLFIKNIENVQGDERDIILFSVAYAKDQDGKMVSQFGPLGQEAGENRLNVAITRARSKVYVVCSFDPTEWTRVETYKSRGVRLLKRYLEYAKAVSEGNKEHMINILNGLLDGTSVQHELDNHIVYDSVFEQQVREALTKQGLEVHTQIGFSGYKIDLGVIHPDQPDKYILGIECDGAMYHSSKVARERDLYRQRFLEKNGWKIHRIWSRNWWKARDEEVEKVLSLINKNNTQK